ncbi:hypothetical protein CFB49_01880 [Burkholderia sp. AU17457]|nr:hypothetical protein CFB49_01880 [Burkholderia sp. AU17457]
MFQSLPQLSTSDSTDFVRFAVTMPHFSDVARQISATSVGVIVSSSRSPITAASLDRNKSYMRCVAGGTRKFSCVGTGHNEKARGFSVRGLQH